MEILKKACNRLGVDIVRNHNSPAVTLLGLRRFPISTIIDVGANEGQFAAMISKVFPKAHIHCFEPLPDSFIKLSEWAAGLNGRAEAHNVALGDGEGLVEMLSHVDHSSSSSLLETTEKCNQLYAFTTHQRPITVRMTSLDRVVAGFSRPLLSDLLIKLDVQGYENRVIKGGVLTFQMATACIVEVCLDRLYKNQATFGEIFFLLDGLGFQYAGNLNQTYANDGHVIDVDVLFIKTDARSAY